MKYVRNFLVFLLLSLIPCGYVFAQESQSLSITLTPPLFQITQNPGTEWRSTVKVVNTNNFDMTLNVAVVDFRPNGETGNPMFENLPTSSPEDPSRMSGWIIAPGGDIVVKRNTTADVPFTIRVPDNADPGGHYAAMLVGTRPTNFPSGQGSGAGISSAVSTLFFLRVPGAVEESGIIRDFFPHDGFIETPDTRFVLRFENTGNVHLVPQGEVRITNMWGKERGKLSINENSSFGNVLPRSTRKFEFDWHGERSLFEVGRYKALATLAYGSENRQTTYRETYFWVLPLKPVFAIIFGTLIFLWLISWAIRRYIRRALLLERERLGIKEDDLVNKKQVQPSVTLAVLRRPIEEETVLLREKKQHIRKTIAHKKEKKEYIFTYIYFKEWIRHYRMYILFFCALALGFSLIGWYFFEVFKDERAFRVEQVRPR